MRPIMPSETAQLRLDTERDHQLKYLGNLLQIVEAIRETDTAMVQLTRFFKRLTPNSYRTVVGAMNGVLRGNRIDGLVPVLMELAATGPAGETHAMLLIEGPVRGMLYDREANELVAKNRRQRAADTNRAEPQPEVKLGSEIPARPEFLLAAKSYIDGWTNTVYQPKFTRPVLPPSNRATQLALRKLAEDQVGDCYLIDGRGHPVGYASLWVLRSTHELAQGCDFDGNPSAGVVFAPQPGRYVGYVSSLRIMAPFDNRPQLLLQALERSLVAYHQRGVHFHQIFVRAHHDSVALLARKAREPGADTSIEEMIVGAFPLAQFNLLPKWQMRAGRFEKLRALYESIPPEERGDRETDAEPR